MVVGGALSPAESLTRRGRRRQCESDQLVPALLQNSKPYGDIGAVPLDVTSVGWDALVALNDAVKQAGGALGVKQLDAAMLHIPATDPLRTFSQRLGYTSSDHENVLADPTDFAIVPAGPVVNGQVQSP